MKVKIYARDLNPEHLNDAFMGEGFETKLAQAKSFDRELVVGEFYEKKDWCFK